MNESQARRPWMIDEELERVLEGFVRVELGKEARKVGAERSLLKKIGGKKETLDY